MITGRIIKRRKMLITFVLLLSAAFIVSIFLDLPNIERSKPDPYFHIKITPNSYWLGFSFTIILLIFVSYFTLRNQSYRIYKSYWIITIVLLTSFIYVIPKFFYVNKIYTDTYLFVGEVSYVLLNGKVGHGWSIESPALSVFTSQFSLITGGSYTDIAQTFLFLIPYIYVLFIYVTTRFFNEKYTSIFATIIFIAFNWFGLLFNRQSFALLIQILTFFNVIKVLSSEKTNFSKYLIMILSYLALVICHPASSFVLILNLFAISILSILIHIFSGTKLTASNKLDLRKMFIRGFPIAIFFLAIWSYWELSVHGSAFDAYENLIDAIRSFSEVSNPIEHIQSIMSPYTNQYGPIVQFRLLESLSMITIGFVLSLYLIIRILNYKNVILFSWFMSTNVLLLYVLYSRSWIYRPIFYSLPTFSIILSVFLTSSQKNDSSIITKFAKLSRFSLLSIVFILIASLPAIMYSHTPFMFPPTSYLREVEFMSTHINGPSLVFEGSAELRYYALITNSSTLYLRYSYFFDDVVGIKFDRIYDVNGIGSSFRLYTKKGFMFTRFMSIYSEIENTLLDLQGFGRIYDSDLWHTIYSRTT